MDVQADQTGQHATIVFERQDSGDQGARSSEPQGTHYADTDQIPAVPRQSRPRRRSSGARGLRITVAIVAAIVLLAAAALGLVKAGVISLHSTAPANKAPVAHTTTTLPASKPLLTETSTSGTSAAYTVPVAFYSVTVSTTTGRSWVSISAVGQRPAFEGISGAQPGAPPGHARSEHGRHRGRWNNGHRDVGQALSGAQAAGGTVQLLHHAQDLTTTTRRDRLTRWAAWLPDSGCRPRPD